MRSPGIEVWFSLDKAGFFNIFSIMQVSHGSEEPASVRVIPATQSSRTPSATRSWLRWAAVSCNSWTVKDRGWEKRCQLADRSTAEDRDNDHWGSAIVRVHKDLPFACPRPTQSQAEFRYCTWSPSYMTDSSALISCQTERRFDRAQWMKRTLWRVMSHYLRLRPLNACLQRVL